jgi:hypothetical protein
MTHNTQTKPKGEGDAAAPQWPEGVDPATFDTGLTDEQAILVNCNTPLI